MDYASHASSSYDSLSPSTALSTPPPPSSSPPAYGLRNTSVDRWAPCTGDMSIAFYVTEAILGNCPSFGVCHRKWADLGFPDIDVSHWPRFEAALLPTNFHELQPSYQQAKGLFLERVSSYWHGCPAPDMTMQQMAPFILLEVVCMADLAVAERVRNHAHDPTAVAPLDERQRLFLWNQTVSHRVTALSHYIRSRIDHCVHPHLHQAHQPCILRVCFGEVYDSESYCARHFVDFIQTLQLQMPNFRKRTVDAANAELPTAWALPQMPGQQQYMGQQQQQQQREQQQLKRKRIASATGEEDDEGEARKQLRAQQHIFQPLLPQRAVVEVIHCPSRVDLFKLMSDPTGVHAPVPLAPHPALQEPPGARFTEILDDEQQQQQQHARPVQQAATTMAGAYMPVMAPAVTSQWHQAPPQPPTHPANAYQAPVPGPSSRPLPQPIEPMPNMSNPIARMPPQPIALQAAAGGNALSPPPEDVKPFFPVAPIAEVKPFFPVAPIADVKPFFAAPLPLPSASAPASSSSTTAPTSTTPTPATAKARAEQSRHKMQRYAARVKRQREALTFVHEEIESALHRTPEVAAAAALLPAPPSLAGNDPDASSSGAMLTFSSAAEKLNYQKRQSKARKRAGEATQMEVISWRSRQALGLPLGHLLRGAIEGAMLRQRAEWGDLIEAEKRLKGALPGGAAGAGAKQRGSKGGQRGGAGSAEEEGTPVKDLIHLLDGPQPPWLA